MFSQSYFSGKISHDLLGSVEIPLKNIPASGVRISAKLKDFLTKDNYFLVNKTPSVTR